MIQKQERERAMNNNIMLQSFVDDLTGFEYLIVNADGRCSLWNKSELSSIDLSNEIDNWLNPENYDEEPLFEEEYDD